MAIFITFTLKMHGFVLSAAGAQCNIFHERYKMLCSLIIQGMKCSGFITFLTVLLDAAVLQNSSHFKKLNSMWDKGLNPYLNHLTTIA